VNGWAIQSLRLGRSLVQGWGWQVSLGLGLPGAAEQKGMLTRPVYWTLLSSLRSTDMAEALGIVSMMVVLYR
jgi:hypothetical protein